MTESSEVLRMTSNIQSGTKALLKDKKIEGGIWF